MARRGQFGDGRTFPLPDDWEPVPDDLLARSLTIASDAFGDHTRQQVAAYYDPAGDYAGNLLTTVDTVDPNRIDAADLFAVSTLSMQIHPRTARALLTATPKSAEVDKLLSDIPASSSITDLDTTTAGENELLATMRNLYRELRRLPNKASNSWVFASKLCARKRPHLIPVRDNLVCELLAGGPLRPGGIGSFVTDVQMYAFLVTSEPIVSGLNRLRADLPTGLPVEASDLRLLDVVLWTKASEERRRLKNPTRLPTD